MCYSPDHKMAWDHVWGWQSVTILWGRITEADTGQWPVSMSVAPGAGSCWCHSGTRSSWGNPSASGRWGSGASWAGAWYPAACWGAEGEALATELTLGACGRGQPCGGVVTSLPRCEVRAWCDDLWGADSLHGRDQTQAGAGGWPAPSLAGCAGQERSESRVLPFRLESLHLRWVEEILQAEAGPVLLEQSYDLVQPSSASCTLIFCFETRSSPASDNN